ncbi:TPM domain-containing protein [Rhodanobacter umsongensis]|uniref:TPM domain-containing protein n=1 Tax=Rhodanobacter umsongensis TaxID=633153 RepID=A0ABW0JR10_9GAMM
MKRTRRLLANLFGGWFQLSRRFPAALLDDIAAAVAAGERIHRGEICFAIESRLSPLEVLDGLDATARAQQVFGQLRVWDTECNSGVLFYVLMAERRIEIVADRGIAAKVAAGEWDAICAHMRQCYARGEWRAGSLAGVAAANELLRRHFPDGGSPRHDELRDRPILL